MEGETDPPHRGRQRAANQGVQSWNIALSKAMGIVKKVLFKPKKKLTISIVWYFFKTFSRYR